jgi:hypothetical protein
VFSQKDGEEVGGWGSVDGGKEKETVGLVQKKKKKKKKKKVNK